MSLWMFPTLEKREDMTIQRYTKLNQKYWYRDNVLGKKKYKREAKNPFGKSKQIWADNYSEWGAKKDDWIELQQSIHETGLSHNELMSLGAITIEELSNEWIYKISIDVSGIYIY